MEFNEKVLKQSAKITAAAVSEQGAGGAEAGKAAAEFLKKVYAGLLPVYESEELCKPAFKAAGKITASALSESGKLGAKAGEAAAKLFAEIYFDLAPFASAEDLDEEVFKAASKVTAAAAEETEDALDEASELTAFFLAVYKNLLAPEKPACGGKFFLKQTKAGFSFRLLAANSEPIGVSEVYESRAAALKGIESVCKNAPEAGLEDQTSENFAPASCPKFELYSDRAGEFRFRLKAKNGQVILASEGYKTKSAAQNGIESVRKNSQGEIAE